MADRGRQKTESPPPPLLLMPAGQGLTLTPSQGTNLLMPVVQSEASLLSPEEEGEADSFLGQTPPNSQAGTPYSYFQQQPAAADPFSHVRQPNPAQPPMQPPPATQAQMKPPQQGPAVGDPPQTVMSAFPPGSAPPIGQSRAPQSFRMSGPPRYAPPPQSTFIPPSQGSNAPPPNQAPPTSSPYQLAGGPPQPGPPPAQGPPPMQGFIPNTNKGPQIGPGAGAVGTSGTYVPVQPHWFYCKFVELRSLWCPFSLLDSMKLEEAFLSGHQDNVVVSTDGGRYDVDLTERVRTPVYWEDQQNQVRRCSWFFKAEGDNRFVPYEEEFAIKLEEEYKNAILNQVWHKRLEFPGGETIVMHNPNVIVHFRPSSQPDEWGTSQGEQLRPRVVRRGIEDFEVEDGEPAQVDHVVFVVHGIGPTCDLRFRNIVECVDDFRSISMTMMQSHFKSYQDERRVGRTEFLPVRWHAALHGDATGIDRKLKAITLNSIGKLRHFTNDTLLDILFYASPNYCQQIIDTVCTEINRLYKLFLSRNPGFRGGMSLAGHSLGSLILFDLLANQRDPSIPTETEPSQTAQAAHSSTTDTASQDTLVDAAANQETVNGEQEEPQLTLEDLLGKLQLMDYLDNFTKEQIDMETLTMCEESDIKEMGIPMGPRKKLQSFLKEQKEKQERKKQEAARKAQLEIERQAREQALQNAQQQAQEQARSFAVRNPFLRSASSTSVDFLVCSAGTGLPFVKYPQLDFSPVNFFALGSPIAMFLTVRGVETLGDEFRFPTCPGFYNIFHPFDPVAYRLEPMILPGWGHKPVLMPHHKGRKRLHLELKESLGRMGADLKQRIVASVKSTWDTINQFARAHRTTPQEVMENEVDSVMAEMAKEEDDKLETGSIASSVHEDEMPGQLNQGRRIDYVLQERPLESFNDYLFALGSHMCYWESEDTVLMILKEIYALQGIAPQKPGQLDLSPQKPRIGPPPMVSPPGGVAPPMGQPPHPVGYASPQRTGLPSGAHMPLPASSQGYAPQGLPPQPGGALGAAGPPPLSGFVRK